MPDPILAYRSLFVSDVHLGSAGCMVEEFQAFLNSVECEYLYLVGDVVDLWVTMKAGKWRQEHTNAVRSILSKSQEGTLVFFTPGNHDAFLRRLNGSEFGNIRVAHSFVHTTVDGKRLMVVHGDLFDKSVRFVPLAWLAAWFYEGLTVLNGLWNARRKEAGQEQTDFSSSAKRRLKKYVSRKSDYEGVLLSQALDGGLDGVVCGHIHRPAITLDEDGGLYVNTGDWVEHGTAVVEHFDGRLELLLWKDLKNQIGDPDPEIEPRPPSKRRRLFRARRGGLFGCVPRPTKRSA